MLLHSEQAQVLMWGRDLITFYNDGYRPLMGTAFAKGIGRRYPEFRPDVWPSIRNFIEDAFNGRGRSVTDIPITLRRSGQDEQACFTFTYVPIFNEVGEIGGVLGTIIETSAQVTLRDRLARENKRFKDLFGQAPTFLAALSGPEHEFEFANPAFFELVGRTDLIGRRVVDAMPEMVDQGFIDILDEVYRTGQPFIGRGVKVTFAREGVGLTEHVADFVYQPMYDEDGMVRGILSHGFDVTEEHRAKAAAEALQAELVQASRLAAMVTMASSLAHELNQPLSASSTYLAASTRLLEMPQPDVGDAVEAIGMASAQIKRAGEIIKRVRAMIGQRAVPTKAVDVAQLLRNSLRLVRTSGICSGVAIDDDGVPSGLSVTGDDVQLEQVLYNLVRNACEATIGIANRRVSVTAISDEGRISIEVADNGPGVPLEMEKGAFDAFKSSKKGGLGVGLAICRTMIEAFDGNLYARNRETGGAVVGFTLPAASKVAALSG